MARARSDREVILHIVWATRRRRACLPEDRDAWLAERVAQEAAKTSCRLLAFGAAADHVHVAVWLHAATSFSILVQRMKGATSRRWNLEEPDPISWQDGYWARSIDPERLDGLRAYVLGQREHHATAQYAEPWEASFDPA